MHQELSSNRTLSCGATVGHFPWWLRTYLARVEMKIRCVESVSERLAFLPLGRDLARYDLPPVPSVGPIWMYWSSGLRKSPPLIRECVASVRRHTSRDIQLLDDRCIGDYIRIAPRVLEKRDQMTATHFSDVLRANLLSKYGGTWIDATVLITGDFKKYTTGPFVIFSRRQHPRLIGSWFIHCEAGHPLMCCIRDMLEQYWFHEKHLREYFTFHYLFEVQITLNGELRKLWNGTPYHSAARAHNLRSVLETNTDFDVAREACLRFPINKLSRHLKLAALLAAEHVARWSRSLTNDSAS